MGFMLGYGQSSAIKEGALYTITHENGEYGIVKILKVDDGGVHIRLYSNTWKERPIAINESELFMVGVNRKPNEELGIGHLPLLKKSFRGWDPRYLQKAKVDNSEFDGYNMWKDANGGYF